MSTQQKLNQIKGIPCDAQEYVDDPDYSRYRGIGTVLVPNDAVLTEAGRELVAGFDARFAAGESKNTFDLWTVHPCHSGMGIVVDADDGDEMLCFHTSDNRWILFHVEGRPDDSPLSWGHTSPIVWIDPGHRYAATKSGSLYTLDPQGFRPFESFYNQAVNE